MKPGSIAAVTAVLASLGACQSITYQKAGAAPQQVEADTRACQEYQLRRWNAMGGNYVENMDRDEFEKPCMEARGYRQVLVPGRS
jgi:hypothetical protein